MGNGQRESVWPSNLSEGLEEKNDESAQACGLMKKRGKHEACRLKLFLTKRYDVPKQSDCRLML